MGNLLISGKEALIALANGEDVQYFSRDSVWMDANRLSVRDLTSPHSHYQFRLKPRTITLNGIEVPAPFKPKDDEKIWLLSDMHDNGYMTSRYKSGSTYEFGMWRTEEEIKQVVAALRSVFNETQ